MQMKQKSVRNIVEQISNIKSDVIITQSSHQTDFYSMPISLICHNLQLDAQCTHTRSKQTYENRVIDIGKWIYPCDIIIM